MIRKAVAGEAAALADLAAATFPLACPPGSSPEDIRLHLKRTLSADKFAEYLADSKIAILVIEQGGRLDGYTLLVDRQSTDPDVLRALGTQPSVELSKCYVQPGPPRTGRSLHAHAGLFGLGRGPGGGKRLAGRQQPERQGHPLLREIRLYQGGDEVIHFGRLGGERLHPGVPPSGEGLMTALP
jgi:hypothetical protein